VAFWLSRIGLPDVPGTRTPEPLLGQVDVLGGLLTAVGLALVIAPLIEIERLAPAYVTGSLVAGLAVLAVFIAVEQRRGHTQSPPPMLPLPLFRVRAFNVANIVTFVVYGALGVAFFLLAVVLQIGLGYTALQAGLAGVPVTVVLAFFSSKVGGLIPRLGARILLTVGAALCGVGLWMLSLLGTESTYLGGVLPGLSVFGIGLVLVVAPVTSTALSDVPQVSTGAASGVNNAVARVAGLVAIAVLPALSGLSGALSGGADLIDGYSRAMVAAAVLCGIGAVASWVGLPSDQGKVPTDA
jgi:hypothetical protein